MSTIATTSSPWDEPSPWTSQGRDIANIKRNSAVVAQNHLSQAEIAEFDAQIRKRYTENRLYDATDVMNLAVNLAQGDQLILSGLMQLAGEYLRNEGRVLRSTFG